MTEAEFAISRLVGSLILLLRRCSDFMPVPEHGGSGTKVDVVHTRQCPELKMYINS